MRSPATPLAAMQRRSNPAGVPVLAEAELHDPAVELPGDASVASQDANIDGPILLDGEHINVAAVAYT